MNNNPKLNWLIRFTLEIFVIVAGVAFAVSRNDSCMLQNQQPPSVQDKAGQHLGSGRDIAIVTVEAQECVVTYRGQTLTIKDASREFSQNAPDNIVIKLRGNEWKLLLDWAIQQDKPVSVMADEQ